MTEPKVSYKGLEEPTTFVIPRLVMTVLVTSCFLLSGSTDAVPTTASSVDHKDVLSRTQRSPTVLNDSSMPALAEDNQDLSSFYDSSYSSYEDSNDSLPITVEVEDDDDVSCSANQYLEPSLHACMNCTTCGPGMQHKIDQACGYGNGFEQICEPCDDGYYQDRTSSNLVRCKRCITCDRSTKTLQECSLVHDALCGPCPQGMYYYFSNLCIDCEYGGSDKEECMTNIPTTREVTKPTPQISPTAATTPVGIIPTTWARLLTPYKGTEIPTTEQIIHGVEKNTGVWVAVIMAVVAVPSSALGVLGAFKLLKRLRKRGVCSCSSDKDAEKDAGKDAENDSTCANPGLQSDSQVHVNVQNGAVLYSPVCQQEPSQDGMELSLPQPLRSHLSLGHSAMFPACSCNGQVALGHSANPASLPREDDAVPL